MVGFGEAVKMFFRRYTDFQGRSSRSEYWWMGLFNFLVIMLCVILMVVLGGGFENLDAAMEGGGDMPPGALIPIGLMMLYFLVILIPGIALVVRRFHDLNQSGWLYLAFIVVGLIPLVGLLASLAMIIWFCMRGTVGPNKYGEDPVFE